MTRNLSKKYILRFVTILTAVGVPMLIMRAVVLSHWWALMLANMQ